ncbi:MAG: cyclic 2,3-diphosphoglycerate synthase [Acidobacteriota bacterium]
MAVKNVLIMGAAGRDFHNFNLYFKDNENYRVVAFTATQIPNIEGRQYPAELAGKLYPEGIPIYSEKRLNELIDQHGIDEVVFSYSDISHEFVMHKASQVIAAGADFKLIGSRHTMLESRLPVISICAVRTGSGKSPATRRISKILRGMGKKIVVIRHPMPYGDIVKQKVQRFASVEDIDRQECTLEEREEYEHHVTNGNIVYAGVDYAAILKEAEKEADIIMWDGGNNDLPFYKPSLEIVIVDPHRPGHEIRYFPGEVNLRRAGVIIISKVSTAPKEGVQEVKRNIKKINPKAIVIEADLKIEVDNSKMIKGKRVLIVEDGPTLTHGEMKYGAGTIAAREFGAAEIIDPRPFAVGSIQKVFEDYPHIGALLPAVGYGDRQIKELQETIERTNCDLIIIGTPIDLRRIIDFKKQALRVTYRLREMSKPDLAEVLERFRD